MEKVGLDFDVPNTDPVLKLEVSWIDEDGAGCDVSIPRVDCVGADSAANGTMFVPKGWFCTERDSVAGGGDEAVDVTGKTGASEGGIA